MSLHQDLSSSGCITSRSIDTLRVLIDLHVRLTKKEVILPEVMKCPLCGTKLSNKFALATEKSLFRCNGCKSTLKAEIESLDKVSRVCGKIGFLISTPIVALLMYKALSTGIYFPYIGCFVLVFLGITLTSYYYAKKNLIFVKAENI